MMTPTTNSGLTVDLGLNIIAQPVSITNPKVTPNANKKKNKYERRRQRSKQNSTRRKATVAVGKGINTTVLPNETHPLISVPERRGEIKTETISQHNNQNAIVKDDSHHQSEVSASTTTTIDVSTKIPPISVQETENINSSPTNDTTIGQNHNQTSNQPLDSLRLPIESKEICKKIVQTATSTKRTLKKATTEVNNRSSRSSSSSKNSKNTNVATIEEIPPTASHSPTASAAAVDDQDASTTAARAAYMAEFHARPMELDRRAGIRHYGNRTNHHGMDATTGTVVPVHDGNNDDDDCNSSSNSNDEATNTKWEHLPLHQRLRSAIYQSIGETSRPTTIQCQAIPLLLQGQPEEQQHPKNIFIHSETGSGKTLAYLLPVLQSMMITTTEPSTVLPDSSTTTHCPKLSRFDYGTRCVIICPTRELAVQTSIVCERMCRASGLMHIIPGCLGGSTSSSSGSNETTHDSRSTEKVRLRKGLGIVIATPGRLLDHLKRTESLRTTIRQIQFMILDEVDRLLDSGLGQQVQEIIHIIQSLIITNDNKLVHAPWRSVFVSATITDQVQSLARDILSSKDPSHRHQISPSWVVVSGRKGDSTKIYADEDKVEGGTSDTASTNVPLKNNLLTSPSFAESSPKQLIQMHVTCSAKLRLTSLIAFLLDRTVKGETTVVFVSTCASVDYYHTLLTSTDCIIPPTLPTSKEVTKYTTPKGIFGPNCPIFKLHGNVPQNERQKVLNQFKEAATARTSTSNCGGSVLFATDVAARGLNLPSVDWIVQFDVPCYVADYVHRAGRVARAGGVGRALLFLLPSEKDFVTVLQQRGIVNMSPMSLTSILNTAAEICKPLTQQGILRGGGSLQKDNSNERSSSRPGEAFSIELQFRLEDCVVQDDLNAKAIAKSTKKAKSSNREVVSGKLIDMARDAFLSYIRAYPTKEKSVRHIFAAKALHLGHVARSFALKEPPKKVVVASQTARKRKLDKLEFSDDKTESSKRKHLSFDTLQSKGKNRGATEQGQKKMTVAKLDPRQLPANNGTGRSLLLANAAKLQSNGLDGL
jgi:ATP-dependent RNA helicase DDX31/DBP7